MLNLVDPVASRRLGIARTVIGIAAGIRALNALPVLLKLAEPDILNAPNFSWFPAPSTAMAYILVGVWLTSAVLVALGWRLPISGALLFASLVFVLALDLQTYSNHLYLMALLVLLLVVADASAGFTRNGPDRMVPRWPITLLCAQVSVVYLFSAITKLNEDFLSGLVLAGVLRDGVVAFPETLRTPSFLGAVAAAAVVTELFIAFGLWLPRPRLFAYVAGVGLHVSMILLMEPTVHIAVFAMLMFAVYPLYDLAVPRTRTVTTAQSVG